MGYERIAHAVGMRRRVYMVDGFAVLRGGGGRGRQACVCAVSHAWRGQGRAVLAAESGVAVVAGVCRVHIRAIQGHRGRGCVAQQVGAAREVLGVAEVGRGLEGRLEPGIEARLGFSHGCKMGLGESASGQGHVVGRRGGGQQQDPGVDWSVGVCVCM